MPLTNLQTAILRLLASSRTPESYVAGATPLNRIASRFSGGTDIFQDLEDRVALSAIGDAELLKNAAYGVKWLRNNPFASRPCLA